MKLSSKDLKPVLTLLASLVVVLTMAGCAAGNIRWNESNPAGFWAGLWHGMIAIITFIISLFTKDVRMYEVFNNGGWYDFGFVLGFLIIWGGSCTSTVCSRRKRKKTSKD